MNSKKVMKWRWGEGRDLQYFDSRRVAGEAFQHFQLYLQVEQFCWFGSFSLTKLPWRQQRPKAEEIYERWKRKVEWAQHSVIWNIALPGRYIKQVSVLTMCAKRHTWCCRPQIKEPLKHILNTLWSEAKKNSVSFSWFLILIWLGETNHSICLKHLTEFPWESCFNAQYST